MNKKDFRKNILFLCILITIFLSFYSTQAFEYDIKYICQEDLCMEGKIAEWNISITNYADKRIKIVAIELINSINNSLIAIFNTTYNPIKAEIGNLFIIGHNQQKTKTIKGKITVPNNNSNLVYHACFTNTIDEPEYQKEEVYTLKHCYDERNYVMPVLECLSNIDCSEDEHCKNNKCIKLECGDCQYISNNECINYGCCDNSTCKIEEICIDKKCIKLNCSEYETFFNHSCMPLKCNSDEALINHSCIKLNCSKNEFGFNHSCVRLDCKEEEAVLNHSCIKIDCNEDEFVFNLSCKKLECMFNETPTNHQCTPLKCFVFQRIMNHRCVNDKQLISKLGIELIVVLIIFGLILIDLRRCRLKIDRGHDNGNKNPPAKEQTKAEKQNPQYIPKKEVDKAK